MRVTRGAGRAARRIALAVAATLMLSACYQTTARQMQATNPAVKPWWCHSEQMAHEHGAQWYLDHGIHKGELSWDDCLQVSQYFDDVVAYATQWPTRGAAEADGWRPYANYAEGMGTHHARNPLAASFDPRHPSFLMYGGDTPDAKLVGIAWFVGSGPDAPPAGFPGDNDWWHQHPQLCTSNQTGLIIFDGPCPPGVDGSTTSLPDYWMLHAWILPGWHFQPDVFTGHHPCLLASGPATPDDECWTTSMMHTG